MFCRFQAKAQAIHASEGSLTVDELIARRLAKSEAAHPPRAK